MDFIKFWLSIFTTLAILDCYYSISVEEELTLSSSQTLAFEEVKKQVAGKLPNDYMYEDTFLIKFLRFQNFDIKRTNKMIFNMVQWREKNGMEDIVNEDFSLYDFEQRFPFWVDGRDNDGRPVATGDISVWEPRQVILAGKSELLFRYIMKIVEVSVRTVREEQKNDNVTQFTLLYNLAGFSLIQHGCRKCIPFFVRFLVEAENNYPNMIHKLFLVNTPSTFETILKITRAFLNKQSTEPWSIHGSNKKQWQEAVLKEIPSNQIRRQFGGTKNTDLEDSL